MSRASRDKRDRAAGASLFPRRDVSIVLVVALAWRLVYALLYRGTPFFDQPVVDAQTFHLWAEAIRDGRPFVPGVYFKPPLYPHVLAVLYDLFGARPAPVYLLQSLMGAATCVLVLGLGRVVFTPRTALVGALVCALLPILPFLEFQLVAEPLTTLLTMAALVLLVARGERRRLVAVAGLMIGIAALGRPNLLVLAPVLACWLWRRDGRRLGAALVLLVGIGVGIAPATLHNMREGRLVLVSANGGVNLWTGIRPGADGASAIPIGILWDDVQLEAAEAGAPDPAAADRWLLRRSLDQMRDDPARAVVLFGRKLLLLVNAHEGRNNIGADWLAREHGMVTLHRWWPGFWLVAPLALLGLAAVLRPRWFGLDRPARPALVPLLWTLAALALVVVPFFVNARFRQPLLPLLALLAAHGAAVAWPIVRAGGRRGLVTVAMALGAFLLVNLPPVMPDRARGDAEDLLNLAGIEARNPARLGVAITHLEAAARLDPANPDVHERLGLYRQLLAFSQPDQRDQVRRQLVMAVQHHRQAIRLFPRSFRSFGSAGSAHLSLADLAVADLDRALAAGDSTRAQAFAREAAGDLEAAWLAWNAALRLKPDLPGGRESLAAARQMLERLPGLDPAVTQARERVLR